MANNNDWRLLLKKVSLFSSFTQKELTLLTQKMTLASFPKGAILVEEETPGNTFYLIVSGTARLVKADSSAKNHISNENTFAFVSRGDALGEMSLLTSEPYPYTAQIESTADVLILKKKDFDAILEEHPHMAVHVSRMLSSHLAALSQKESAISKPAELISFIPAIPHRDQVLLSVNLGISLVEQTRKKTLLFVIDDGSHLASKSLKLDTPDITENHVRDGYFQNPKKFDEFIMIHPCGLEVISITKQVFYSLNKDTLNQLINLIRDQYDYALFILPPEFNESLFNILHDSTHNVFISSPQSTPKDLEVIRQAEQSLPPFRPKERLWLMTESNGVPSHIPVQNRIPWDKEWGRKFMTSGSPFIPFEAHNTRRRIDRLARFFGKKLIGFAMGSGAAFGYSIIGMLRVLENEGIIPDIVCGTSMGALIGSFYCSGLTLDEMEDIARSISRKRLWRMARFSLPRSGLLSGKGVLAFLQSHLGDATFKDLQIPFSCVATDIQSGREIVLDDGSVAQAVRASLSLPVYFQPYYTNGRYLVDGGLVNPVPNSVTLAQGANILLSANLTSKAAERKVRYLGWRKRIPSQLRGPNVFEILMKTIYTMQYEIAEARAKMAHVNIELTPQGQWWWDLDKADEIIKLGEVAAEENLPKIKSLLPYFSDSCQIRLTRRGRKIY